jgi:predicted small lipoprotein YifL
MQTTKLFAVLAAISFLLAACGAAGSKDSLGELPPAETSTTQSATGAQVNDTDSTWADQTARQDAQGAVTVVITPLNLNDPGDTIDFDVSLNTHSVDLNMDLAALATLSTDTGLSVSGVLWTGERGGHHVQGTLSFPASTNNLSLLDGASELTLTIRDLDAAERVFSWAR